MMTMRQIASGDGDEGEGQDQDHGHDERGVMRKIQPIPRATAKPPKPRMKQSEKMAEQGLVSE